jgi:flagellar motor switch/type III secretory pathway protein FliN
MNDILSAAEIDPLFDQASQGRSPSEHGDATQGRRARWLRTVDFTRPSKFGIDQQRRLRRIGGLLRDRLHAPERRAPHRPQPSAAGAELSAVGEAMNQMMSAAAAATGGVLGQEIRISPPQIRVVADEAEAIEMLRSPAPQHLLSSDFTVADAPSRLVQLVPNAFVVRMERALHSQTREYTSAPMGDALRSVPVRVWAELGRARMRAGSSLGLPTGSVVELDREVDDAVDLYVDGMRCATGRLLVAEDGSLQLVIDEVFGLQNGAPPADQQETSNDSPTQSREV